MCRKHYHHAWSNGRIPIKRHQAEHGETEALLRAYIGHEGDECLIWPFALDTGGYGQASLSGERMAAHRAMCLLAHGEPPFPTAQAAHSCGRPECFNQQHIRWATVAANHDDKRQHGTMTQGEKHPRAGFTEAEVLAIASSDSGLTELARKHGCTKQAIYGIRTGKTWSWLTGIKPKAA